MGLPCSSKTPALFAVVDVVVLIDICPVLHARKWKKVSTANTAVAANAKNCNTTKKKKVLKNSSGSNQPPIR
jgi:hypothetical protein